MAKSKQPNKKLRQAKLSSQLELAPRTPTKPVVKTTGSSTATLQTLLDKQGNLSQLSPFVQLFIQQMNFEKQSTDPEIEYSQNERSPVKKKPQFYKKRYYSDNHPDLTPANGTHPDYAFRDKENQQLVLIDEIEYLTYVNQTLNKYSDEQARAFTNRRIHGPVNCRLAIALKVESITVEEAKYQFLRL